MENEIRGRAAIYRACCRVLKVRGRNQYADNAELSMMATMRFVGLTRNLATLRL